MTKANNEPLTGNLDFLVIIVCVKSALKAIPRVEYISIIASFLGLQNEAILFTVCGEETFKHLSKRILKMSVGYHFPHQLPCQCLTM